MNPQFKLKYIKIRNFLSIGEQECNIQLDAVDSTLIVGGNGSGKTTIIEAITYALYGRTYRRINKANIVNSFVGKDGYVELGLDIRGDEYKVIRTIKPDSFEIYRNGERLDELSGNGNQKKFEALLGIDFNLYKQYIVLGTSGYEEFMRLSKGDRRKLLIKKLELDVISFMDEENKGILKNLDIKMDLLDKDLDNLKDNQERFRSVRKSLESMQSDIMDSNRKHEISIKEIQENLEDKESSLETLNKKLRDIELNIDSQEEPDLKPEMDFNDEFDSRTLKMTQAKEQLVELKKEREGVILELNHKIATIENTISTLTSVIDRYEHGEECPSCLQQLHSDNDKSKELNDMVSFHKEEIKSLRNKSKEDQDFISSIDLKIAKVDGMIDDIRNQIISDIDDIRQVNDDLKNKWREKLSTLTSNKRDVENEIGRVKESITRLQKDILNLNQSIASNKDKLNKINEQLSKDVPDHSKEILEMESQKDAMLIDKYQRNIIGDLLKDDGIRRDMINRYIPLFNTTVQKYLDMLGADYIFTVDSEFQESILSRGREKFRYESFSRGEQARIDLAILFSWREIIEKVKGHKLSLLILDEVFDSATDANGVENIKNVLNNLEGVNVFSISHREHNSDDFNSVIRVNKVGRFSRYEREFN